MARIGGSAQGAAVVNGMVAIASALGLRVVAEGVETAEELDLLRQMGCELAQGFHIDRPLPIEALAVRWLHPAGVKPAVA